MGKIYIFECMIYLSKYINISAFYIRINLCICQKHVMILTAIDIKIYTIYDPQKIIYQTIYFIT